MQLKEIFDQLANGELSQLSIGGVTAGEISTVNYAKVLSHVSLGLTALYKRFPLKEGGLIMQPVAGQTLYEMAPKYAVSSSVVVPYKHILDSVGYPFTGDILKMESVITEDDYEMHLNNKAEVYTLTTPTMSSLRIPADIVNRSVDLPDYLKSDTLKVTYRANHPKIDPENVDPEYVTVELPDAYLEALLYYVASRVNNPIGMTGEFNAGNNYSVKFERACQQLEQENLKIDQGGQNSRAASNGWV